MPTANDYRNAAARFRAMAETLADEAVERRSLGLGALGLTGPAATEVEARLQAAVDLLLLSSVHHDSLARECLRRAEACDDHLWRLARRDSLSPLDLLTMALRPEDDGREP